MGDACRYEWSSPSLPTDETGKQLLNQFRSRIIEDLSGKLAMGQPHVYRAKEIDHKKRDMLETLGIRSGVIIPMFVDRQWWGCLGLEQCFADRDWQDAEIYGLKKAAQILGTLMASARVEQPLRQLTGSVHAVFWISAPDGLTKQYVSPGYEEIWGRTRSSLQGDPGSWIQAIHSEDQAGVNEALTKQAWGEYDEEFRVQRPDGSLRWVHDRAFPVRDQAGNVYRIAGIAVDITKQKEKEEQLRALTAVLSSFINHLPSGVLVEDDSRRIIQVNQSFIQSFTIPIHIESFSGIDSRLLFAPAPQFIDHIQEIINAGEPVLGEELEWQNKIFLRDYVPLSISQNCRYHLWQYQDITESRHKEAQIEISLKEKEVLLKEIHQRFENNLQIISSMMNLQSAEVENPKARQIFTESEDRVKALALIHERVYQSGDLSKVDFAGYVRSLAGRMVKSYKINAAAIRLNLQIEPVQLNLDIAIPCGQIIHELVSNAFKYAFPQSQEGDIKVSFSDDNGQMLRLVVCDNGIGFPEDRNPEESDSPGLKLVRNLTEQIGGKVQFRNLNGFLCEILIPQS
jgi:PAS domain S-box-containing protein